MLQELNVLLMWRNEMPYKDCWALPGGFVDFNEGLEDNVKRKLKTYFLTFFFINFFQNKIPSMPVCFKKHT